MAKKKNTFGKLLTFTTAAAAIGGTCYIFRDKIKQSSIYKNISGLFGKFSDESMEQENNDFLFNDDDDSFEDVFSDGDKQEREYTSITINPKEETEDSEKEATDSEKKAEDVSFEEKADNDVPAKESLSDVSEDPDVLEEQDKLDF